jgi:hypothetical protein
LCVPHSQVHSTAHFEYTQIIEEFHILDETEIEKNLVFWDIKTEFVLHGRHVFATESSQLMLCKI